ncbi:TlpA disulfide reductase family protein [Flavobacterium sp.]|uniref:TlpA family protein disulfide reductase n=1 Tax=Flavobacterium sp. TaxID=239 RepID=UPI0026019491|nr:TlpA disulfide reductase family protein [Flavobacterium sp.]
MPIKPYFIFAFIIFFTTTVKAQTYSEQYQKCSEELTKLTEVDSVYFELLKKRNDCLVGTTAPNFTAKTVDNEEIELSKLIGKVVVLNFWFTKCEPCIKEMPYLNKLATTFSAKDVAFISFAPEDSVKLKAFFSKHPFKFKTIPNSETIRRDIFKLFSIWPYTIIIDKTGKINKMGFGTLDEETFPVYKNRITDLLQ